MPAPSSSKPAPAVVECKNLVKRFYYYSHRTTTLREWFIRTILRKPIHVRGPEFILRDFNLSVKRGEVVALIGPNGSGKSTVLRLIAGIYAPTQGTIEVHGRISSVIELGAGFHPDLTGAENIDVYGSVMGLSPDELKERYDEIVRFADLGDFIDTPIKYYSSGMQARLAFAVAMSVHPDVVLLDEVMAVGDEAFRERCLERLEVFLEGGGTIIVVTHELETAANLCHRAVWIKDGAMVKEGPAAEVVAEYRERMKSLSEEG